MARAPYDSDRDFPADPTAYDEGAAGVIARSAVLEPFDEAVRLRFGQIISVAAARPAKRR
jgi:hypothetical protein